MHTVPGLPQPPAPGGVCRLIVMLLALVFLSACAPSTRAEEELRKEIQALKEQVATLQEKLNQVQTGQQAILDLLKKAELPVAPPVARRLRPRRRPWPCRANLRAPKL